MAPSLAFSVSFPWVHPVVCLCRSYPSFHFPLSLCHTQVKIRIQPDAETEALSLCVCVSISVCVCVVDVFWDAGLWESKNALVPAETLAVTPCLHLLLIHTLLCQATRNLTLCSDGCGGEGKSWQDVFWWYERELGFVREDGLSQHAPHTQTHNPLKLF